MISRFKNVILHAAGVDNAYNPAVHHLPQASEGSSFGISSGQSSQLAFGRRQTEALRKSVKHDYSRPHFLKLTTADEIMVSADHLVRPILVPRDINALPWNTGYAETINSGKSKKNEDQACFSRGILKIKRTDCFKDPADLGTDDASDTIDIPYYYFGIFDGHAGHGAAVTAAAQLHHILHERLAEIGHHLLNEGPFCESSNLGKNKGILWFPQASITNDSLVIGALESSFEFMDAQIDRDHRTHDGVNGGCTVVVCLFLLGKVFIANAGDSRAVLCQKNRDVVQLSNDFTPESERSRIRQLAEENPQLLGNEFTALEYAKRPSRRDIGSKILYRGGHMTGWAYKLATEEDLRFPVVFGHGKRSRVLATIGVTRGLGDHGLTAHGSVLRIKPFMKCQPEVKVLDLKDLVCDEDDVIVMATDGLWDVTPNDTVGSIIFNTIELYPETDFVRLKYRYISAAQDLVMHARGKFLDRNWRMSDGSAATIDDISVFVIPISPFRREAEQFRCNLEKPLTIVGNGEGTSNEPLASNNSTNVLCGEEVDLLVRVPFTKERSNCEDSQLTKKDYHNGR